MTTQEQDEQIYLHVEYMLVCSIKCVYNSTMSHVADSVTQS